MIVSTSRRPDMTDSATAAWPELRYDEWSETCSTLHRWTQVVGKIRLARTPWLNHSWHVPLYVTVKGLTTSAIPYGHRSFDVQFDFHRHVLDITVSAGTSKRLPLQPRSCRRRIPTR